MKVVLSPLMITLAIKLVKIVNQIQCYIMLVKLSMAFIVVNININYYNYIIL